MENIYNYKTASISASFKDADSKKGIVTGYFSAFNNKDSDGDIIVQGAFTRTIEERGPASNQPRIKHLLNHRSDQPLGKITMLIEDAKGLYYESVIGKHILGKEFIAMVESDLITEHSIGFKTIKKEDTKEGTVLKELQLWEGSSLTGWAANAMTPLTSMKNASRESYLETLTHKHKAIERFCNNAEISDETIEGLLLYNKQLFQLIIDLTNETTSPGDEPTLPDNKAEVVSDWINGINNINSLFKTLDYGLKRNKTIVTAYT